MTSRRQQSVRQNEKAKVCKCSHAKHQHARGSDLSWSGDCGGLIVREVNGYRDVTGCDCANFEEAEKLGGGTNGF